MNVFVTGATGTLGRPLVPLLVRAGHVVRALSSSEERDAVARGLGAVPVRCDLFDPVSLRPAAAGCEAVLHLATRIPPARRASVSAAWAENDRIRGEGTRNLVDAAAEAGARTFVYPSVVLVYPDRGSEWIDAATPPDPLPITRSTLVSEAEVERFSRLGRRGIVLRMGVFYGPSAPSTLELFGAARRGFAAFFGREDAYQSSIWVEDAAAAIVTALERAPAGVYDAVDDEPLTRRELTRALAEAVGRPSLTPLPLPVARLEDSPGAEVLSRSQRVSNRRLKEAAGWAPAVGDAREGMRRLGVELAGAGLSRGDGR